MRKSSSPAALLLLIVHGAGVAAAQVPQPGLAGTQAPAPAPSWAPPLAPPGAAWIPAAVSWTPSLSGVLRPVSAPRMAAPAPAALALAAVQLRPDASPPRAPAAPAARPSPAPPLRQDGARKKDSGGRPALTSLREAAAAAPQAGPASGPREDTAGALGALYDGRPAETLTEAVEGLSRAYASRSRLSEARDQLGQLLAERAGIPDATRHGEVNARIRAKRKEILSLRSAVFASGETEFLRRAVESLDDPRAPESLRNDADLRRLLRAQLLLSEANVLLLCALHGTASARNLGFLDACLPWWLSLPVVLRRVAAGRDGGKSLEQAQAKLREAFALVPPAGAENPRAELLAAEHGLLHKGLEAFGDLLGLGQALGTLVGLAEDLLDSDVLEAAAESSGEVLSFVPLIGSLCRTVSDGRRAHAVYSRLLALERVQTPLLGLLLHRLKGAGS